MDPLTSSINNFIQVNNPLAHEYTTGPEIIEAVIATPSTAIRPSSGKVDAIFAGAGTGGTVTGLSRAIRKKHNPECVVVAVDPVSLPLLACFSSYCLLIELQKGSILALPDSLNAADAGAQYVVEGIGYDFVPDVLDRSIVSSWVKTSDEEAFEAVRSLMRLEGLLVGGSSGSALSGALEWLKSNEGKKIASTKGANVVVLLPDG